VPQKTIYVQRSAIISLIALSGSAIDDFCDGRGSGKSKQQKANMAAKFKQVYITNVDEFN
jgi:hypothetical protein